MGHHYHRGALVSLFLVLAPWHGASAEVRGARPQEPGCHRASFRTIVDVGHTLESPGAFSARGVTEYQFNLNLAKAIEQKLVADGFSRTVMLVTSGRTRSGLFARVSNAGAMQADLYLSVHHDSVPELFKEKWDFEGKTNQFSDRFTGHSLFVSFDNPELKASLLFGKLLGHQLKARQLQYTPHYTEPIMGSRRRELVLPDAGVYRYDQLIVLRHAPMPAVLLEAGMIVNRNDELALASPERQMLIAAAVSDAVEQFCAHRAAEKERLLAQAKRGKKPATETPKPAFASPVNPSAR